MVRKKRKSEIDSQLRQTWLERNQAGESIFKLSVEYQRDPRTIKQHVERALREKEAKEARIIVIRNALERHQARLITYARKLYNNVKSDEPISPNFLDDLMYGALKSHLPRSPLWNNINRINSYYEKLDELKKRLRVKIKDGISEDKAIPTEESILQGLIEAFSFQLLSWARGRPGISQKDHFRVHAIDKGKSDIEYGSFHLNIVSDSDVPKIREIIKDWEKELSEWPEYYEVKDIFNKLDSSKVKTKEDLSIILERGIVPGRCKYCPV